MNIKEGDVVYDADWNQLLVVMEDFGEYKKRMTNISFIEEADVIEYRYKMQYSEERYMLLDKYFEKECVKIGEL